MFPVQGEDNELLEADAENNKVEDPANDPVNGEVNKFNDLIEVDGENDTDNSGGARGTPNYLDPPPENYGRKNSCHL